MFYAGFVAALYIVGRRSETRALAVAGRGPDLLREHWPGPDASRNAIIRLAYGWA